MNAKARPVSPTGDRCRTTTRTRHRKPSQRRSCICDESITSGRCASSGISSATTGSGISDAGVYRILCRNGLSRLPRGTRVRKVHTKRYNKQVPGHHIQMDVKFLTFKGEGGQKIRRFQYTAIDDATRIRALRIYDRHTQANAIDFVDHVISVFPFRIREIRTDNGHEFQAKFHWHVEDKGIRHAYIKASSPQLNGKVERSHRADEQEFYQLLSYKSDADLKAKLQRWERFYNLARPHGAHNGKTPYEALREKL